MTENTDKFCCDFFLLKIQCSSVFIDLISHAVQKCMCVCVCSECGQKNDMRSKAVLTVLGAGRGSSKLECCHKPEGGTRKGDSKGCKLVAHTAGSLPLAEGCLGAPVTLLCSP
jgi:hypothetical protein